MYNTEQEVIFMSTINERFRAIRLSFEKKFSQEAFAKEIGLSRSELANIEYGKTEPKEFTIKQVCETFGVNEVWLRHGEGEMFRSLTRKQEIAKFVGDLMADEEDSFRSRLIFALSNLDTDEWKVLEKVILDIAGEEKKG